MIVMKRQSVDHSCNLNIRSMDLKCCRDHLRIINIYMPRPHYAGNFASKLTLNMAAKTEFMLIASRQKLSQFIESPSLTINQNAVEQLTSTKSLGVNVDQNINWECHIENISKKIACAIDAIYINEFGISLHLIS